MLPRAVQSSTNTLYTTGEATLAIDGNTNANIRNCTHTNNETNPWWAYDMLTPTNVTR